MVNFLKGVCETIPTLQAEINSLKNVIAQNSQHSNSSSLVIDHQESPSHVPPATSAPYEEVERSRSVIISGVLESQSAISSQRALHDFSIVRELMDHLYIDANPVAIYRLGVPQNGRNRLIKLVLPASYFARTMLHRASWLRNFRVSGLFLRPSLPKQERDRRRNERLARKKPQNSSASSQFRSQPMSVSPAFHANAASVNAAPTSANHVDCPSTTIAMPLNV